MMGGCHHTREVDVLQYLKALTNQYLILMCYILRALWIQLIKGLV